MFVFYFILEYITLEYRVIVPGMRIISRQLSK